MEEGSALLQFVHKNAEMGKGTIPQVLEVVEEPRLREALKSQLGEYEVIAARAARHTSAPSRRLPRRLPAPRKASSASRHSWRTR